jgi:hypothetical protein
MTQSCRREAAPVVRDINPGQADFVRRGDRFHHTAEILRLQLEAIMRG